MNRVERSIVEQIPGLRRYARALTRDPVRADDLVQDCLERAYGRRHQLRPGSNVRAWLFTVMHNVFVNQVRREGVVVPVGGEVEPPPAEPPDSTPPSGVVLRDLDRALSKLSHDHREVLLLVGLEQLSYRETAEVLGVAEGTVMSRLARARQRLRTLLEERPGEGLRRIK